MDPYPLLSARNRYPEPQPQPYALKTTVEASVGWRGNIMLGAVRCNSATLYVNGQTYNGSVSNPWYSTKCKVSFNNIPVNTNAYITVRGSYLWSSKTVSAWRWVPKPSTFENVTVADIWFN